MVLYFQNFNPNCGTFIRFVESNYKDLLFHDGSKTAFKPGFILQLNALKVAIDAYDDKTYTAEILKTSHPLLDLLNSQHFSDRRVYSEQLKAFCLWDFLTAGRKNYEARQSNLPVPSISTLKRDLFDKYDPVVEGEFRGREYVEFCHKHGFDTTCALSEDGTRIEAVPTYDIKTKKIVGFVPKLGADGFPISNQYVVKNNKDIEKLYETEEKSNTLYIIMAQSISHKAPPFCLCAFSTNNKFTWDQVTNRFNFMITKLKSHGVRVIGLASDQDPRLFKAMKNAIHLGSQDPQEELPVRWNEFFSAKLNAKLVVMSDVLHFITKLKTRLTKKSCPVVIGNKTLSLAPFLDILESSKPNEKVPFSR